MSTTVGFVSLGCAKNRVDCEMMMSKVRDGGFRLIEDAAMSDIAIINTCGFIESAKQESINEILELSKLKEEGKIKKIVVTGCLAQRYAEEIRELIPEVDVVLGLGANGDICSALEKAMEDEIVESFPKKELMPLDGKRVQSTLQHYAYLRVADGCDNCCTYCAIPLIRGSFRSRKIENILEEAKTLVQNGVKELNVIAQDTTRYGEDIYSKLMLPELLKELCKIEGLEWVRILYCYPDRITDELIDTIKTEDKIVKYIDLPLQHCNGEVLKRMNRKGDKETLTALINKIRAEIPDITLRTTLIAGFPGETQEQFTELSQFVKDMKFERLGCFAYSQEEDTKAGDYDDQLDEDVKAKRAQIINEQQAIIMQNNCEKYIGKTLDVLVDGFDRYAECYFGRSVLDAPEVDPCVFFTINEDKPKQGDIVKVKINDYLDCDLVGEMEV
ncbi:MAG: 30S ribosomal protein S12 methylthiotransferase RimO [Ruminococcus sp.]|nr:30S ribosomal protein S12 methylthiotransferase RimO [Ruminococcus sp.]MBQ7133939.1 30S ribosomal protein S12 methylthiotransferase RimO [Ruminococcus sp.]